MSYSSLGSEAFWSAGRAFEHGDNARCSELLDFAVTTFPELTTRREWKRFAWKRRLGRTMWTVLRPVLSCFRGGSSAGVK
jgi:hypothetical protein